MSRRRQTIAYPSYRSSLAEKQTQHSDAWKRLDRIQVLGDDARQNGHSGCVNALSWSSDGSTLVSSGDDTRICLWRLDGPKYECQTKISTGHRANVFSAQYLPTTSLIATAAGDRQVRVFDAKRTGSVAVSDACIKIIRCHTSRVKRIVTQDSPSYFLSVSEDHTVRSHDLRVPHTCDQTTHSTCPSPLVRMPYRLSTLATSPLTPWLFVVAGEMDHGYLFDRRMMGRVQDRWGVPLLGSRYTESVSDTVHCVRRFGRSARGPGEHRSDAHVTGSRMASSNGHELLLSYHADAIYRFSINDDPSMDGSSIKVPSLPSPILSPNRKRRRISARQDFLRDSSSSPPPSGPQPEPVASTSSSAPDAHAAPASFMPVDIGDFYFDEEEEEEAERQLDMLFDAANGESSGGHVMTAAQLDALISSGDDDDEDELMEASQDDDEVSDASSSSSGSSSAAGVPTIHISEADELEQRVLRPSLFDDDDDDYEMSDEDEEDENGARPAVGDEVDPDLTRPALARPIVFPTQRYAGLCNVETIKDVNFLGPNDEYVASGSDDGLFFLWNKQTASIEGIWDGDESVVNCIESHPSLPLVAVSGIDNSVKLFAPDRPDDSEITLGSGVGTIGDDGEYTFASASRLKEMEEIVGRNKDSGASVRRAQRIRLEDLALHLGISQSRLNSDECTIQ